MKEKVFVTGGGGFLGSTLISGLLNEGFEVISYSRKAYSKLEKMGVNHIVGDLIEYEKLLVSMEGCKAVFHTAGLPAIWGDFRDFYASNLVGTINIIAACKRLGIPKLIYTSSPSVIFNGKNVRNGDESLPYPEKYNAFYPMTKARAERFVLNAADDKLGTVALRPHLIWGPGDKNLIPRIVQRSRTDNLKMVGDGDNIVDTVYVENAAFAHMLAEKKLYPQSPISGKAYFITQDDPVNAWGFINSVLKAIDYDLADTAISPALAYAYGALSEFVYWLLDIDKEPKMTRFLAHELSSCHWFNISAAKRDLGYYPKISSQEAFEETVNWLKKEIKP